MILVDGFISLSFFAATLTFDFFISLEVNKLCLCILERFMISLSTRPIVPIPALTRFSAAGQPNPPTPTIKILVDKILSG